MKFFALLLLMVLAIAEPGQAGYPCSTVGDYFEGNGRYLGSDGINDGRIYIANNRKSRQVRNALEKGDTIIAQTLSKEIPSFISLVESLDVLERTESNGGFQEEVSLVFKDGSIVKGKPGPIPTFGHSRLHAEFSVPRLPIGTKDSDVVALIHSHPTSDTAENRVYYRFSALIPSEADRVIFERFSTNIIVGSLRLDSFENPLHDEKKSTGIAVYNQNTELLISLKKQAVQRIIQKLKED